MRTVTLTYQCGHTERVVLRSTDGGATTQAWASARRCFPCRMDPAKCRRIQRRLDRDHWNRLWKEIDHDLSRTPHP